MGTEMIELPDIYVFTSMNEHDEWKNKWLNEWMI